MSWKKTSLQNSARGALRGTHNTLYKKKAAAKFQVFLFQVVAAWRQQESSNNNCKRLQGTVNELDIKQHKSIINVELKIMFASSGWFLFSLPSYHLPALITSLQIA